MELTPEDKVSELEKQLTEAKALLIELRDAGSWYPSALEIDSYRDPKEGQQFPLDGEALFNRIVAIVGYAPVEPDDVLSPVDKPLFNWD